MEDGVGLGGWMWMWMCGVGVGGGGGGESSINHRLSPEPQTEGTCNFIYLIRKVHLSILPNYS